MRQCARRGVVGRYTDAGSWGSVLHLSTSRRETTEKVNKAHGMVWTGQDMTASRPAVLGGTDATRQKSSQASELGSGKFSRWLDWPDVSKMAILRTLATRYRKAVITN